MSKNRIKLRTHKVKGESFVRDSYNQKLYEIFEEQAVSGDYWEEYTRIVAGKTDDQLAYWYGGVCEGMVEQLIERGDDVLYEIKVFDKTIPIMTNKDTCDDLLKKIYMVSIGKAGIPFSKGKANIDEMIKLIDWAVDYLPRYWQVYIMSPEEYKRSLKI